MKFRNKAKWGLIAVFVVILLAGVAAVPYIRRHNAIVYSVIPSPDGRYKIVVYGLPQFIPVDPGQGGDANGFVQLQDNAGHVLQEKDITMVQNIDQVYWTHDKVDIKLFAEWNLP
jgi:hypothetical protein